MIGRYIDWCVSIEPVWLGAVVALAHALVVMTIVLGVIWAIVAPYEKLSRLRHEAACEVYGRESISQSVWHGKTSTTYYACRDPKTGQMYAE